MTRPALRPRLRFESLEDRVVPASGLDPSFGDGGRLGLPVDQPGAVGFDEVSDVATRPDGRVVFAGHAQFAGGTDYNAVIGRLNPDGTPDPTFAGDGLVVLDGVWYGTRTAVLPDGGVVVAGEGYDGQVGPRVIWVVRLTAAGELDQTFDGDGVLTIDFPAVGEYGKLSSLAGVDVTVDGRVLLTGSVFAAPRSGEVARGDFGVLRLTADGRPDPSFGTGGLQTVRFDLAPEAGYNAPREVVALPDGRVLVAGSAVTGWRSLGPGLPYSVTSFAAARLTADGALDPTFGDGGKVTVEFPGTASASLSDVAVLPDGGVVLAGEAQREQPMTFLYASYAATRLTVDGSLDPTFGDGGRVTVGGPEWFRTGLVTGVGVLPDGRVLLAGMARSSPETESRAAVLRLTAAGAPDPTYGRGGLFAFPFEADGYSGSTARTAGLFADGRVVLAGWGSGTRGSASDLRFAVLLAEPGTESLDLSYTPTETSPPVPTPLPPVTPPPPPVGLPDGDDEVPVPPPIPPRPAADLDGDGTDDAVTTDGPRLRVVGGADGTALIDGFAPYEESFTGGIAALLVDLDGDGRAEVVTAPKTGGAARVQVFAFEGGALVPQDNFFAFADVLSYRGGASVAVGDVNGDGRPDLIVGAGSGGGPRVAVFDGRGLLGHAADPQRLVADFFAFEPEFIGGVLVASYDPNGFGPANVAVGARAGGAPRMLMLDGEALMRDPIAALAEPEADVLIGDPAARAGVEFGPTWTVGPVLQYRAGGLLGNEGWVITGIQIA